MITIDGLAYQSKLRTVNSFQKFCYAMITLCFCVGCRRMTVAGLVLLVNSYLLLVKSGISVKRYFKLMLVPASFILLSVVAIVINVSKQPMDLFAFALGEWYLTGSIASLQVAGQLVATAIASVSCLYFLSLTTPMTEILRVLKTLRVPSLLIELTMLTYRYIFVLLDLANQMTLAQRSRLSNVNYKTSVRSFVALVSMLFIKTIKKSTALYDAMESRCYDGVIRVVYQQYPAKVRNTVLIVCYELLLCVVVLVGRT